jgi:uncharacterized integral membrane protein (TIGR00698 family)
MAILFGAVVGNTIPKDLNARFTKGTKFASTTALRAGIICVGAKLSLLDLAALGAFGAPAVATCMSINALFTLKLGERLGVDRKQAALVAIGSTVCGVTAITALSPAIKASERETAAAVAGVVLFGTTSMVAYPYIIGSLFHSPEQVGTFFGLAIHDTSQVMGAALTYAQRTHSDLVVAAAATTKLTRNLFLAAAVPAMSYYVARGSTGADASSSSTSTKRLGLWDYLPPFVVAFVAMVCIKSAGEYYLTDKARDRWMRLMKFLGGPVITTLLTVAMAGTHAFVFVFQTHHSCWHEHKRASIDWCWLACGSVECEWITRGSCGWSQCHRSCAHSQLVSLSRD